MSRKRLYFKCTKEDCENKYYAKGYCNEHYHQEYFKKNKRKISKYYKEYYQSNKNHIKEHSKQYQEDHPEVQLKSQKKTLEKLCIELDGDWTIREVKYALQSWSKTVKKRDIMCQICRSIKDLHAHHIFYKRFYSKLCLNLNNGITLCHKCHMEAHGLD